MADIENMSQLGGVDGIQQFDKDVRCCLIDIFKADNGVNLPGLFNKFRPECEIQFQPALDILRCAVEGESGMKTTRLARSFWANCIDFSASA